MTVFVRRQRVAVAVLAGLASGVLLLAESLACSNGDRSAAQVVHEHIRKSHVCRDGETGGTCRRLLARGTSIHAHGIGHQWTYIGEQVETIVEAQTSVDYFLRSNNSNTSVLCTLVGKQCGADKTKM